MTPKEWNEKYGAMAQKVKDTRVLFFATTATMVGMSERIWGKGELTNGGKLTYKEDYQVYIYKPPFPQAPNGKGKTGRKIKGQWAASYLKAKGAQGRADTPFELTGDMRLSWLGGPTPTPREVEPLLCQIVMSEKEFKKASGLQRTKGVFLGLSAAEVTKHTENVREAYKELVLGA